MAHIDTTSNSGKDVDVDTTKPEPVQHDYSPPAVNISSLDVLRPVHPLIIKHFRHVDPVSLARISTGFYAEITPSLYERVIVNDKSVEQFFYGMCDLKNARFLRNQGKLHAVQSIKSLGIEGSHAANIFLAECKKFGRIKTPSKGVSPFAGVEHLELARGVFKGIVMQAMGHRQPVKANIHDDLEREIEPIPNKDLLNCIAKYFGGVKRICINWGDWKHDTANRQHVSRIGSGLIKGLVTKLPLLERIIIHTPSDNFDELCKLDLDNLGLGEGMKMVNITYQMEKPYEDYPNAPFRYVLHEIWKAYKSTFFSNQLIKFSLEDTKKDKLVKDLGKLERDLHELRRYPHDIVTKSLNQAFDNFKGAWIFNDDCQDQPGKAGRGYLCECRENPLHVVAKQNWREWERPTWTRRFRFPQQDTEMEDTFMPSDESDDEHDLGFGYDPESDMGHWEGHAGGSDYEADWF
ncbi:uncharacterized protein I303_100073 [Kwoniella dejecticola CBS 10117]|uniref:Uncharacterized protein n=1 Tax=Kwoniella dejecticola CBS 10117 TaxID=1296121 RepID=A0A1A6ADW5_9TREE|nr:uncharacterized protein I303_00073 [Kwoniella dejecticola CBS 10117]OBR88262.1 hypothetical protein I303_00073 [Kwoniella dejecticola CBS 10117]